MGLLRPCCHWQPCSEPMAEYEGAGTANCWDSSQVGLGKQRGGSCEALDYHICSLPQVLPAKARANSPDKGNSGQRQVGLTGYPGVLRSMAPPPSATEEPEQVEALPLHALSVTSPSPEPVATANGAEARCGPAAAPGWAAARPRLGAEGCSLCSTANGEPAREVAPAKAPNSGLAAPAEVDSALRDGLVCQKTRGIGARKSKQMVLPHTACQPV